MVPRRGRKRIDTNVSSREYPKLRTEVEKEANVFTTTGRTREYTIRFYCEISRGGGLEIGDSDHPCLYHRRKIGRF